VDLPDHRRLGRQLEVFATEEECGSGLPFWLPAGATIRRELERFVVELERRHGYRHVNTPAMAKRELYERSGHWAHYQDAMYPPMDLGAEQLVLRPMICPHHILLFASEPRSLRELPVRLAEIGSMFRYERSGVVGGLSRVRQMTLNDGHVFCAPQQVQAEISEILAMVDEAYRALDIPSPRLRFSRAGAGPKYAADAAVWERGEAMIRNALDTLGLDYAEAEGGAAFYGPKIDLQVTDPQGREETLSTVQVDFHLPSVFALSFRRADVPERPVIVHRSIVSTMERMVAHLIEVHIGALPVWLAPTQIVILPVNSEARAYAVRVRDALAERALRAEIDDRDATLAARVRRAQEKRIPYLAILGARESAGSEVSVRLRDGTQLPPMKVDEFRALVEDVAENRRPMLTSDGGR
jgi:threonyl-tRNA synthetase